MNKYCQFNYFLLASFALQLLCFTLERWSIMWMRVMDMWRSKCGGQEPICPRLGPSPYALARPSPSLQKVSSQSYSQVLLVLDWKLLNSPIRSSACVYSTRLTIVVFSDLSSHSLSSLQLVLTTWASVVTWILPRASACKHSGSQFWMTWVSQSWRGLRGLSLSYVCQWTASWENLGRLRSSSMTLCLTVSDVDLLLPRIYYYIISHLQYL